MPATAAQRCNYSSARVVHEKCTIVIGVERNGGNEYTRVYVGDVGQHATAKSVNRVLVLVECYHRINQGFYDFVKRYWFSM